ncbi:hypothetical protein AWZ03_003288 [Drosophila navojoa]|uniref:Uncharacterized protein n=1 Tax=Drosophila navojoa TaxID=7232 RepID=A0A484BNN8_DRONA|nr:uncharacterized protein LOC108651256 [Drosophila navojoa]TDG50383.1 hypothetical protein AWZ03_003288 [Drosophila navojoa]
MDQNIPIKTDSDDLIKNKSDIMIPNYLKRLVLEYLQKHGCTHANLETVVRSRRKNQEKAIKYICQAYKDAEVRGNQECESVCLRHINQWLELLNNAELSNLCEYEAAAVINSIVRTEVQPKPEQLGGIDLSEVYGFLENALTGQAQKRLSDASEAFLAREIELLIEEANNDHSDKVVRSMGEKLYERNEYNYEAEPNKCSLDPLFLDE